MVRLIGQKRFVKNASREKWLIAIALAGLMLLFVGRIVDLEEWAYQHRLNHSRWWCPICCSVDAQPRPVEPPETAKLHHRLAPNGQ
jgi:hypothetical protein